MKMVMALYEGGQLICHAVKEVKATADMLDDHKYFEEVLKRSLSAWMSAGWKQSRDFHKTKPDYVTQLEHQ